MIFIKRSPRLLGRSRVFRTPSVLQPIRFNSRLPNNNKSDPNNNDKPDEPTNKSDEVSKTQDDKSDVSTFKIKPTTTASAPAPIDPSLGLEKLLKKDNKPYIPKLKHQRVSFEYPGLPNQDEYTKLVDKPKRFTRWTRYIPKMLTAVAVVWTAYAVYVFVQDPEEGEKSLDLLDPNEFHKFVVTYKEPIDDEHMLIEIKPKYNHWEYAYGSDYENKTIWNGERIWSVEIKQPEIMVVRSYTPLPLYFLKSEYTRSGERKPLLKVIDPDHDHYDRNGTMCLYVKRYGDGEVSRFITNKEIGEELELRGPRVEYKFPYHPLKKYYSRPIFKDLPSKVEPENYLNIIKKDNRLPDSDNIDFYAGGTGIAPILQVLFSRNPTVGFVNIHYSARKPGELGPLQRFMFFLEKLDRIKVHYHYDTDSKSILSARDIQKPENPNYLSPLRLEEKEALMTPQEAAKFREDIKSEYMEHENFPEDSQEKKLITEQHQRGERFDSAIEQAMATSRRPKKNASLALVCGPEGYIEYVAGAKKLASNEQGEVAGLLGKKKWDNTNVYKL
ncbi:CYC2 [[Candida] subhashii]|uniref:CYC2 n=1 Tax=[Candida] subhashii TaxID=561895 RepID=A0A8J5QSK5_9ASCO|nr:CYC2 [[Candida] subhashii]KAG7665846.1 CYC2 [[Candida] subhashii]